MSDLGYNVMPPEEAPPTVAVRQEQLALTTAEVLEIDALVQRTRRQVLRSAWRKADGDTAIAEEGFQEAYLRLMERWTDETSHLSPRQQLRWLRSAAQHAVQEAFRNRSRNNKLVPHTDQEPRQDAATLVENLSVGEISLREVLRIARKRLKGRQLQAFELKMEGLTYEEIADEFGTGEASVRKHVFLARKKLRKDPAVRTYFEATVRDPGRGAGGESK